MKNYKDFKLDIKNQIAESVLNSDIESFEKAIDQIYERGMIISPQALKNRFGFSEGLIKEISDASSEVYREAMHFASDSKVSQSDLSRARSTRYVLENKDGDHEEVNLRQVIKKEKVNLNGKEYILAKSYNYDDKGNLRKAAEGYYHGKHEDLVQEMSFTYDEDGRALKVMRPNLEAEYGHSGGLITSKVIYDGVNFIFQDNAFYSAELTAKGTIPEVIDEERKNGKGTRSLDFDAEIRILSNSVFRDIVGDIYLNNGYLSDEGSIKLIQFSMLKGDKEMVKCLVDEGARTDFVDDKGNNLLHYAIEKGVNLEILKYLTKKMGLDEFNVPNEDNKTPLKLAIEKGNVGLIEYLHEQGFDLNAPFKKRVDGTIMTPSTYACKFGAPEIVEFLLDEKIVENVNVTDFYKRTLLDYAKENSNPEMAKLLVDRGALEISSVNEADRSFSSLPEISKPFDSLELYGKKRPSASTKAQGGKKTRIVEESVISPTKT